MSVTPPASVQAWRELDEQQWQPCTNWQQMDMELAAAGRRSKPTEAWQVLLTAPVQHLHQLWQLRLQVSKMTGCVVLCGGWRRNLVMIRYSVAWADGQLCELPLSAAVGWLDQTASDNEYGSVRSPHGN